MAPPIQIHFSIGPPTQDRAPPRTWTQQDFVQCLLTGVLSAMPYFLEAFLTCLAGGGAPREYRPGDRPRCGT